jgi:CubicO group peptidase (beta-lactamase class C family)
VKRLRVALAGVRTHRGIRSVRKGHEADAWLLRRRQLYLQKGEWNGEQLIPAEWVELATSKQVENDKAPSAGNPDWRQGYGFQFWQCRHGAFRGDGKDGQFCVVMPEQNAVVVMTALTGNMQKQLDLVWEHLLPALQHDELGENPQEQAKLASALKELTLPKAAP